MTVYVPLQVPESLYDVMLRHLGSLMSEPNVHSSLDEQQPLDESQDETDVESLSIEQPVGRREWSPELWARIWRELPINPRRVLYYIAERHGSRVHMAELGELLGSSRAVQDALSSFTKRARKWTSSDWPFLAERDTTTGRFVYDMSESTARIILELARESGFDEDTDD
jgi:hypothetical protein